MKPRQTTFRVGILQSLRTQLFVGATVLLATTIAGVGYFLIVQQERTLTAEMEKAVVLQGRNVALSSEKALLRNDPEFELYPLVTRILDDVPRITALVITDASDIVQGHRELVMISRPFRTDITGFTPVRSSLLRGDEHLHTSAGAYLFTTPVISSGKTVGNVYITYSKTDLIAGIHRAFSITLRLSVVALALGLILSLAFFTRISSPLRLMLDGVHAVASGRLDARIQMPVRNEFRILANSFNEMSDRLADAQKVLVAKERTDRELEIARDIQQSLLPRSVVAPKGFAIAHYYEAANEVGGDYVDVIELGDGRIGMVMADVSGKGIPGLVVMAMVKIMAQELITSGRSPREVLCLLNEAIHKNIRSNMFVTIFTAVLDPNTGRVAFSNAGHNPLLLFDHETGTARLLRMEGVPLGAFTGDAFRSTVRDYSVDLKPGDLLLQYTDGLHESRTAGGRVFTLDKIVELAHLYSRYGADTLIGKLVNEEKRFRDGAPQADDITLLAVNATSSDIGAKVPAL